MIAHFSVDVMFGALASKLTHSLSNGDILKKKGSGKNYFKVISAWGLAIRLFIKYI